MSKQAKPIRSMTGFARVRKTMSEGELVLSLKSLNHRGLDIRFHTPAELDPFENAMRSMVNQRVTRGHLEVRVSFFRTGAAAGLSYNRPVLEAYLAAFRQASKEFGIPGKPDLNAAFRVPGVFGAPADAELPPDFTGGLLGALDEALGSLNAFREREGAQLVQEIRARCESIGRRAGEIDEIRSRATALFQARLAERLAELLQGAGIDPQRLAQETAILVDRSDIGEELARLRIHSAQIVEMLAAGGELGKRMDFLLQEMHRESNTILSKTGGTGEMGLQITDLALGAKADIEKIRELALNLE